MWSDLHFVDFQTHLLQLISAARSANIPTIGILHANSASRTTSFHPQSGHVKFMQWLPQFDHIFTKSVHNALTDSGLLAWLHAEEITHLTISGIRTEQCCETTTRVASDLGFTVDFITQATLTFAMTHPDGTQYSVDQIKKKTELVLFDRFARIKTVEQAQQTWLNHS